MADGDDVGRADGPIPAAPAPPGADDTGPVTTFLVIVHARLTAEHVPAPDLPALAARVAEAFIARDDAATVWIHLGTAASRITLDVPAADRDAAIATAVRVVREGTAQLGVTCEVVATAATTERERAALPVACPADDGATVG
jgi:hypothetical protein